MKKPFSLLLLVSLSWAHAQECNCNTVGSSTGHGYFYINGNTSSYTDSKIRFAKWQNGNGHIDVWDGKDLHLNYYRGKHVLFGRGNGTAHSILTNTGRLALGTTQSNNGILTIRTTEATNILRLENDGLGNEAQLRFRAKTAAGATLHGDISMYATGSNQGYLGFKVPHSNTANSGYDLVVNHDGRVGIGTVTPSEKLHLKDGGLIIEMDSQYGNDPRVEIANDGNGANSFQTFYRWTGNTNLYFANRFYQGGNQGFKIQYANATTLGNHAFSDGIVLKQNGLVGIGTPNPDEMLTVNGTVHSSEVKVDLSVPGPDYVFEPDYDLRTLEETEKYIKENKHLPEVPPAKAMEANGVQLGEMNMLLLKKIEELTLHQIAMHKELNELKSQNKELTNEVKKLKSN